MCKQVYSLTLPSPKERVLKGKFSRREAKVLSFGEDV
jgi:hypothetical protein